MVILVDRDDNSVGTASKREAHEKGLLHRAVSVLLFNGRGELLLQRRAAGKYHSGGLWANTCCTHPYPGEASGAAAERRLREELGIAACLHPLGALRYYARLDGGMTEHELDHLFVGRSDTPPAPDPAEVAACRYLSPAAVREEMALHPERFAVWFRIILERFQTLLVP
ncbi:isopentenyl-diphosphate Delta-isomerase [Alistipes sp.]|uniref:isopentenyl-diphosphate Delta-isomerase n=1 Tax=Alistipes sp. TaxID=1872444 RepID=UPI003AF0CCDA